MANLENKRKLEAEFTSILSQCRGTVDSSIEDLASRMDPAILEAADMPMDIRSSGPISLFRIDQQLFQQVPIVLCGTKGYPAPKQEAKINPKENSQAVASADSSNMQQQQQVLSSGYLLDCLFQEKETIFKMITHYLR